MDGVDVYNWLKDMPEEERAIQQFEPLFVFGDEQLTDMFWNVAFDREDLSDERKAELEALVKSKFTKEVFAELNYKAFDEMDSHVIHMYNEEFYDSASAQFKERIEEIIEEEEKGYKK